MDPRWAGLSGATPSVHMLNPSCCLSVRSPLLLHIAHVAEMLDGAPAVLIIWSHGYLAKKKKIKNLPTSLGAVLAHKELCLSDCSEALCS